MKNVQFGKIDVTLRKMILLPRRLRVNVEFDVVCCCYFFQEATVQCSSTRRVYMPRNFHIHFLPFQEVSQNERYSIT